MKFLVYEDYVYIPGLQEGTTVMKLLLCILQVHIANYNAVDKSQDEVRR